MAKLESMEAVSEYLEANGVPTAKLTPAQSVSIARTLAQTDGTEVMVKRPSVVSLTTFQPKAKKDGTLPAPQPMITIEGEHRPFSFGRGKANILLNNWEDIVPMIERLNARAEESDSE